MEDKFKKLEETASEKMKDCSAHNIDHVKRVYNLCLELAEGQELDLEVLRASALLHDIGGVKEIEDLTGKMDHALIGAEMAGDILKDFDFSKNQINHIQDCIISHRFRNDHSPKTLEAKILFDADKLDALGFIGIARLFVWIGRNKAKIYSKPNLEKYIQENHTGGVATGRIKDKTIYSPQIAFETKTKFLKDRFCTAKGKEMAKERTVSFKNFLDKLEEEIEGRN